MKEVYPKVTIITPSFNHGEFLEKTIKSVIEQNYPNLEYLVFDGGSNDNSVNIIKKYEKHINYWESKKDKGQSHAINKGFNMASGKYVNWLNSDDVLLKDGILKLVDYLENNPTSDVVYGNVIFINSKDDYLYELYEIPYSQKITLYALNYLPQPATLYKLSLIKTLGPLREDLHYCMDHELWLRLYKANSKFSHINDFIAGYRLHKTSKGIGHVKSKLYSERLRLKLEYGFKINNSVFRSMFYLFSNIYYRLARKVWQLFLYRKINIIPTSLRLAYLNYKKKLF